MTINMNKEYLSEVSKVNSKILGLESGIITNQWPILINLFMNIYLNSFLKSVGDGSITTLILELFHQLSSVGEKRSSIIYGLKFKTD